MNGIVIYLLALRSLARQSGCCLRALHSRLRAASANREAQHADERADSRLQLHLHLHLHLQAPNWAHLLRPRRTQAECWA